MAITLAHTGLTTIDLNNMTTHFIDNEGVNLGNRQTTWDEEPSYAGGNNSQVNVRRGALIHASIPMRVKGTSVSDLKTKLDALWTMVETCTDASPGTLTWDAESYTIVYSTRPETVYRDPFYQLGFLARFTLVLTRRA